MGTCSSILAWEIPWTEEPGELHSVGLQSWTRKESVTRSMIASSRAVLMVRNGQRAAAVEEPVRKSTGSIAPSFSRNLAWGETAINVMISMLKICLALYCFL